MCQIQTFALRSSCTAPGHHFRREAGSFVKPTLEGKTPSGSWRPGRPDDTCATLIRIHEGP
jgi:hypothetical protein